MRFGLIVAAAGVLFSPGRPPPPPEIWNAQVAFFSALPDRFPAADLAPFERLVADDVQVYRDGILIHRTRADWIRELQSYKQKIPTDPQGFSVSRDQYTLLADGSVSVREFTYPIAPEGKSVVYYPDYPLRYVSYRLAKGRLVRVDYGPAMSSYSGLCQKVAEIREKPGGRTDLCR